MKKNAILTKGLMASGKTTWAKDFIKKNPSFIRLSRDDFRHMLDGYSYTSSTEDLVTVLMSNALSILIQQKKDIIIDETHLNEKFLNEKIKLLSDNNYNVIIKEFPITLGEAIERDKNRQFTLGAKVLKDTWRRHEIVLKQLLLNAKPKIEYNSKLKNCIICDIDGTLADSIDRKTFDFDKCITDKIIDPVKNILLRQGWFSDVDFTKIFLLSGRDETCRKQTEEWLQLHKIPYDGLFMRTEKDNRKDTIIKTELYNKHIVNQYNVLYVIDDRPCVVQMWVNLGLFVFNVNQDPYCKNDF